MSCLGRFFAAIISSYILQSNAFRFQVDQVLDLRIFEQDASVSKQADSSSREASFAPKGASVAKEIGVYVAIFAAVALNLLVRGEVSAFLEQFGKPRYALFVFSIAGLGINFAKVEIPLLVVLIQLLAVVPCAFLIEHATDLLAEHTGPQIGALLNCSFGNLVEIIIGLDALWKRQIDVVQGNILGSIYSNLLVVVGVAFVTSGVYGHPPQFDLAGAQYDIALMLAGQVGLLLPTQLYRSDECMTRDTDFKLCRCVSIVMAVMYVLFVAYKMSHSSSQEKSDLQHIDSIDNQGAAEAGLHTGAHGNGEENEALGISILSCSILLAVATYMCSIHCDLLIEGLDPMQEQLGITKAFSAVILLPIVGNISTIWVGFSAAKSGNVSLAVEIALSSTTQCMLMVFPLLVFIGQAFNINMDLMFSQFDEKILLAFSLFAIMNVLDGKASWIKGVMSLACYTMMAITFFFYHSHAYLHDGLDFSKRACLEQNGVKVE